MKYLLPLFLLITLKTFSQSNECTTATMLTDISDFCSANAAYTNVGSTTSGYTNATCWTGTPTEDVWFTFVSIGSDLLISLSGNGTGGGTMVRPRIALYTGNCTTLTQVAGGCSDGSATSNITQIYLGGLTQGTTYFLRVSSTQANEGTFKLCVNSYTPPLSATADCSGAGLLCNKNSVSASNFSGSGSSQEANIFSDCFYPESNSVWYKWTCQTAGTLTFNILPATPTDDIDFILYELPNGINSCTGKVAIRCSGSPTVPPAGTGLSLTAADLNEAGGCTAGPCDGLLRYVDMIAGRSYALMINNFTATSGMTLSFGGTGTFVGPNANITIPNTTVCDGTPVSFNGSTSTNYTGLNWNFTNGPGNPSSATGPGPHSVTYPGPGTYTAILNATGNGCTSTESAVVTVTPRVTPTFAAIGPLCQGTTPPALPASSTNSPAITGTWSPSTINTSATGTTVYTFTPTAGLCANTATLSVTVTSPGATTFGPITNTYCSGAAIPALPTTSTNSPAITGTWAPAINNTATTTYTFTPGTGQCASPTTFTITITPQITPTFGALANVCQNATAPTLPTSSTNSPAITGTWSPAFSTAAAGTFTSTFTPAAGQCATTTTLSLTVTPTIVPTFNAIPQLCVGDTPPALPATSTNGINGTWSPSTITTAANGTTTYTFTPSAGQCSQQQTLTVVVGPPATPTFTQIAPFCAGTTAPTLPGTSNNNFTGTWSPATVSNTASSTYTFTPGTGQCATTTTMSITVNQRVTPTFTQAGPYCQGAVIPALPTASTNSPAINGSWSPAINNNATTTYTFTPNNTECANPATMSITINNPVTPTFSPLTAVCMNTSAPPLVTSSTNTPAITGSWSPSTFSTSTAGTFTATFTPGAGQCATTATLSLTVLPQPVVSITPAAPQICQGESVSLTASGADNFTWAASPSLSGTSGPTVTASPSSTTTYTVTGETGGCTSNQNVTVMVNAPIPPAFNTVGPYCSGAAIPALPATSNNGINGTWAPPINNTVTTSYTFTPNTGQCSTPFIVSIQINDPAPTQFAPIATICAGQPQPALPAQDLNGIPGTWSPSVISNQADGTYTFTPSPSECALPSSVTAIVLPNPVASFSASHTQMDVTATEVDFYNNSANADSYEWEFGDGAESTLEDPSHTFPNAAGSYNVHLTATNSFGCEDDAWLNILIKEDLFVFVPNSFTPDGDAYNNTFEARISGDFDQYNFTMTIFNRWGEVLFESHDVNVGWDGTYGGQLVKEGAYTWKIALKTKVMDDRKEFVGTVILLK